MKASFDGARRSLVLAFNQLVASDTDEDRQYAQDGLRSSIGGLLCMYDDNDPNDCNDLSDMILLDWPVIEEGK